MSKLFFLSFVYFLASSNVSVLTTQNFDHFIQVNERVLVEFYAPWCGHCKKLQPEYDAAAQTLKDSGSKTVLAKVDSTKETEISTRFGVKGFPTLKYFIRDPKNALKYGGGRKRDEIVEWVTKRELPPLSELTTSDEIQLFKKRGDLVLIAYVSPTDESTTNEREIVREVAENLRDDLVTGVVQDETLIAGVNRLELWTNFNSNPVVYQEEFSVQAITSFFNKERFPPIGEITAVNYQKYQGLNLPIVWVGLSPTDAAAKDELIQKLNPFAIRFKGRLSFAWVNADRFSGHVENLGIDQVPGFVIIDGDTNRKFKFSGDLNSATDVANFWDQWDSGNLPVYLRSEPAPESNDGNVRILVGTTFEEEAFAADKAVFVEFYAPWCGHCKKLQPEWNKLGESLSDRDDVVVAKMDSTENDSSQEVQSFPTIVLYGKDCSNVGCGLKYKGGREANQLLDFINENYPKPTEKDEL